MEPKSEFLKFNCEQLDEGIIKHRKKVTNVKRYGDLTIINGPMFSGKSTYGIDKIRKIVLSGHENVGVCKYSKDTRYSNKKLIVTHDGKSVPCKLIQSLQDISENWLKAINNLFIEEAQFFIDVFNFTEKVRLMGINVYIITLNLDYKKQPWLETLLLFPYATEIISLKAHCEFCGSECLHSRLKYPKKDLSKLLDGKLIGGAETWITVCDLCYDKDYDEFHLEINNLHRITSEDSDSTPSPQENELP
jgi:thymidine kinase